MLANLALIALVAAPAAQDSPAAAGRDLAGLAAARPAEWLPLPVIRQIAPSIGEAARAQFGASDAAVRARAAFIAGEAGDARVAPFLRQLLADPERAVRLQAGIALGRLGDEAGKPAALAALTGPPAWVRYYAVLALWTLGADDLLSSLARIPYTQPALVATALEAASSGPSCGRQAAPPASRGVGADVADWEQAVDIAFLSLVAESDWWWHEGDHDRCVRCNEVLVFLDPTAYEVYTDSAWLLWSSGRHTRAIGTYHRCIEGAPWSNHGLFYLGYYYYQHGLRVEAEPYLRRATEVDPTDDLARRAYAHCLEKLERPRDALAQWEAVLKLKPGDGSVLPNLERLRSLTQRQTQE